MDKTLEYYNKNAKEFVEGTLNADMSVLYTMFRKYVPSGSVILDMGCGSGRDTKYFTGQGYTVVAMDGSEELCKLAENYTGQEVLCMAFNELDAVEQFDGIWACSSILHVPKDDLPDILHRIQRALKLGGYLYASFKYGAFSGNRNGRYFTDLTEDQFTHILDAVGGFEVIESFVSKDVRAGRADEKWLNLFLKRTK